MRKRTVQKLAPYKPVSHAGAWTGQQFSNDSSWLHVFTDEQVAEMRAAVAYWSSRGTTFDGVRSPAELLPSLMPLLRLARNELASRGFLLLRGVPVDGLSRDEAATLYWAIGMLVGVGTTQNAAAEFLCPVTDRGVKFGYSKDTNEQNARGYQSRADLNFHCDPTDVVALLCLRKAMSGGLSAIVSSEMIFNIIAEEAPEHLPILMRGFPYDRKGENSGDEAPVTPRIPVFALHGDRVSCRYARSYISGGADKLGTALTADEIAALDFFDGVARRSDVVLHMAFEPGDIQLLNNYTTLHGRTAYEDHADPDQRRFLYRLWLMLDGRPWNAEDDALRYGFARFGNLGRTLEEWRMMQGSKQASKAV
jgi:hypothetical protein